MQSRESQGRASINSYRHCWFRQEKTYVMERARAPHSPSSSSLIALTAAPTTTFVQTDQATFKELVQRLTGPAGTSTSTGTGTGKPPAGAGAGIMKRRPAFKAQGHRAKLTIIKPGPANPVLLFTPAITSPSSEVACLSINDEEAEAEEKAIRERRFYLHPSPRSRESVSEPELLTLFPLTSPGSSAHN